MSFRYAEAAFVGAIASTAVVAAHRWHSAVPRQPVGTAPVSAAPAIVPAPDPDSLDRATDDVVNRDPFRVGRLPSTVLFVPAAQRAAIQAAPPPPRPTIVVKGIIGGPPWMAIVDGIPGQQSGLLVRAGTAFDKIVVRSISRDSVLVQLPDTTLRLSITRGTP